VLGDVNQIDVTGRTVGECLDDLVKQYPGLKSKLFNKDHNVANGVNIFVNAENAYPEPMKKPVKNGDKIYISFIVLGG